MSLKQISLAVYAVASGRKSVFAGYTECGTPGAEKICNAIDH